MDFDQLITHLKSALSKPLPGELAHRMMMPVSRNNEINYFSNEPMRKAAVLICLFPENNCTHTIFIERTQDAGPHSGQIAFPGGKHENTDQNLVETAIREANEELSISSDLIEVIGQLSPINIPVSGFSVLPVLAKLQAMPKISPNTEEVKSVVICDLLQLFMNKEEGEITVRNICLHVPYYYTNGVKIWGATAMLLSEMENIIKS